ncbi:MAG TPA: DUF192 domain-containing protein [Gammaproteobacteria bacterium]
MLEGNVFLCADDGAQTLLLERVLKTGYVLERMRILLLPKPLQPGVAMLIDRCDSVHTCGIRHPLDLAFMDRSGAVRRLVQDLKPWRVAACSAAYMTLEMPAGTIERLRLETGMRLLWRQT